MKRMLDIIVASLGLLFLSPVFLVVFCAVKLDVGTPVFFKQKRAGRYGQPFEMIKFRTMRNGLLPDNMRITKLGRFLRASSLDELPELWNILAGNMSLVGPRPLLIEYLPYYTKVESRRHEMRPGLTGLAQISGRNNLSWEERLALDVEYVEKQTFALDLVILFKTAVKVFLRSDIQVVTGGSNRLDDMRRENRTEFKGVE